MMPVIRAGTEIVIATDVLDELLEPPALFSPQGGVKVTLHPPSGASPVDEEAMTLSTVGHYTFQYQSDPADVLGVWTIEFKVQHNSSVVLTPPAGGFVLVA